MSFQSLKSPFLRSVMISVEMAGPMPLMDSSWAWLALFASTAAKAVAAMSAASATRNFFNISRAPGGGVVGGWLFQRQHRQAHGFCAARCPPITAVALPGLTPTRSGLSVQPVDVAGDAARHVGESMVATSAAKAGEVGLGEALVLADQGRRKVDVLDLARAHEVCERQHGFAARGPTGIDDGERDIVERLGPATAEIEDATGLRMLQEPEVDGNDIVDEDEVAPLLAGRIAAILAEQLDAGRRLPLLEVMKGNRRHAPL